MSFDEVLDQVRDLLQREGRVSYRALKRRFGLDDDYLEDLKDELIKAKQLARDEEGAVLVWTSGLTVPSGQLPVANPQPPALSTQHPDARRQTLDPRHDTGERRQLTVMFCDLVGSTSLSERLDPEDLREVVRAYQAVCEEVIHRFEGYIARYVGDALLIYFGYPTAQEDAAARAVRAGLAIVAEMPPLNARVRERFPVLQSRPLQVRIGMHSGLVVVGAMGAGAAHEQVALGETPNLAARVQGQAEADEVVISAATYQLVQGLFACADRGLCKLKGVTAALALYRVVGESGAQSRFEVAIRTGLTPLVGRESELGLLRQRWEQAKMGAGQVVLLSGEPGIGKSRLVQEITEQLAHEGATCMEFRCSSYHQNSALYPIIDHLQRLLQLARDDSPAAKLEKLQYTLSHYRFPQTDTVPLLAALLSLPHPAGSPPITMSPQKQKEKTQATLVAWLVEEAERQAVYCTWEDVHWTDPSTLEILNLIIDQAPTARLYVLLTFRPEFTPPWGNRSHLSQMTLSRLSRTQVREMVRHVADQAFRPSTSSGRTESESSGERLPVRAEPVEARRALPPEVVQQIVAKTDGVPLFVEELTKMVLESIESIGSIGSVGAVGSHDQMALQAIAIPATLHDSLMARLDRLGTVKEVAQLGATIGREFSYELLQAVSPLDEETLQHGLKQLVEAELVYQRGLVPQAHYLFKHALIQDTAYQSLLKSTRQQYHRQIGQVLADRFPETVAAQPELVAQHYTEASLIAQAIPYWKKAGQRASQGSAHREAINHLTKGLEGLKTLPDTSERAQHELTLQIGLGGSLLATKGPAAFEVGATYARARELCQQVAETPQLFPVLWGLRGFYSVRGEHQTARELGEQFLHLAQSAGDPALLLEAQYVIGVPLLSLGEFALAREHFKQGIALYDPQQHRSHALLYGQDPGVGCLTHGSGALWSLGYPDQALKGSHDALILAHERAHPYSLAFALSFAAALHQRRREEHVVRERAEATIALSSEQGFAAWLTMGTILRGWALAEQGQGEEGIAQMRQGLAAWHATGAEAVRPYFLALLAGACGRGGQAEEGLTVLAEALAQVDKTGERMYEAELYRLKGELLLTQEGYRPQALGYREKTEEAEGCFLKAIEVARKQQAKSLELRTATSLARLWQQQDKTAEARQMLAEIYGWFTEGFDTKDLQEAKAFLEELSH